jgi:hypothetical protein
LSTNLNAIELLKNNIDKVCWTYLSNNPNIFEYDYNLIKNNIFVYKEELIAKALHPKRVIKWIEEDYEF